MFANIQNYFEFNVEFRANTKKVGYFFFFLEFKEIREIRVFKVFNHLNN